MRMNRLFWAAAAATLVVVSYADVAKSEVTYPYCAMRGGRGGSESCGYSSLAQCRASVHGAGGWCQVNPRYGIAGYGPAGSNTVRRYVR